MNYIDETLQRVVTQNPGQSEFHQAVSEVLESLRPVIDKNEEKFRRDALLERMTSPSAAFCSAFPGWTTRVRCR